MNKFLDAESLDALKTYVTWHVLNSSAPWLSKDWVDTNFKFRQNLSGQKQIQDRWKRCVDETDSDLGEALGQKYVEVAFGADSKQRMLKMVDALEKSLDQDIAGIDLAAGLNRIGAGRKRNHHGGVTAARCQRKSPGFAEDRFEFAPIVIMRDEMAGSVSHINSLSTQIATAAEQQSAVTEEINRSMVQIRHMVDELVESGQASELNTRQLLEANSRVSAIMGRFKVR